MKGIPVQSPHRTYRQSKQRYPQQTKLFSSPYISEYGNEQKLDIKDFTQKKKKTKGLEKRKNMITSRRQSCSIKRLIQRVPGMDLVLTTRYFPLGFHTSIDTGFAIETTEEQSIFF